MKLIVGLGNQGKKYEKNRHNVGHIFIDWMAEQIKNEKLKMKNYNAKFKIFKTNVFMNDSGRAVKKLINHKSLIINQDLIVVHDDLDIKLGDFKIQKGKGPRLHNGIVSIEKALGTADFWRVRIGVDNRNPENRIPGEKYVLMNFSEEELKILEEVFAQIPRKLFRACIKTPSLRSFW